MSSVRRRLAATSFAAAALLALGACGFEAQTNQVYQAAAGANSHGDVDVLNAVLVANEDGSATVSAGFVNNTKDEQALSNVTVTTMDGKELVVRGLRSLLPLPTGRLSSLGYASDAGGFRVTKGAEAGYYVKVTFTFSNSEHPTKPGAASVTIEAPVVARTAEYDKITGEDPLPAEPTPSATETAE